MSNSSVRVRFAPSPTGYLHVGGARTALYDFLYAQKNKGTFVLRVEDTDEERSTEDSLRQQLSSLQWLGLKWDEGLDPETLQDIGDYGPYRQSQRKHIYQEHAQKLLDSGKAYYCFLTDEEIEKQREEAIAAGRPPQVQSPYKDLSLEEAKKKLDAGESAVVRFKTPDQKTEYKFTDLVRGEVTFPSDMVGDFVLLRSGGMPVYNFCCAIDDALMKMTHVFRAEEHLSNTLRQMMLYEAFGYELPQFGHVSIILGSDRQKLSKRHGATSVDQYKEMGYLPEAMNNFLALMGWSSPEGKEVMSMQEMADQFSTDRLNPASAVFDEVKLKWMNSVHLRALPAETLWSLVEPVLKREGVNLADNYSSNKEWQARSLEVFKSSMEVLADAVELYRPLAESKLNFEDKAKDVLSWDTSRNVIETWKGLVEAHGSDFMTEEDFLAAQDQVKSKCEVKGKHLFMPIRVSVIGKPQGAELKQLVPLMEKSDLLDRATQALGAI